MAEDRFLDRVRTSVMHVTSPARESPQTRRPEVVPLGLSLLYPIASAHIVKQQVREQIDRFVAQRSHRVWASHHRGHMALGAANLIEQLLTRLHYLIIAGTP